MTDTDREHLTDEIQRIVSDGMRHARDDAFDVAIELCEEFARTGHTAQCCADGLRRLKARLPPPPSRQN